MSYSTSPSDGKPKRPYFSAAEEKWQASLVSETVRYVGDGTIQATCLRSADPIYDCDGDHFGKGEKGYKELKHEVRRQQFICISPHSSLEHRSLLPLKSQYSTR
ncbi:hypothetical protein CLAIMM_06872 [Cladophialophora immunda]|nr:hypothetical protein CLAIMM_06872 [Cladophialophora immunda]